MDESVQSLIMKATKRMKQWAARLKTEVHALYLAYRDPRVPWYARLFALCVAAYALSPLDLIPDMIPVLGYLDDLLLIPLGVVLAIRMIPDEVLAECRERARAESVDRRAGKVAAIIVVCVWILVAVAASVISFRALRS